MGRRAFKPTHEIRVTVLRARGNPCGAARTTVIPVRLVGQYAFNSLEWSSGATVAGWRLTDHGLVFRGRVPDRAKVVAKIRLIGRGSMPKRGAPGRNRSIRVPDVLWARFKDAARRGHLNVTDWLIDAAQSRLASMRRP